MCGRSVQLFVTVFTLGDVLNDLQKSGNEFTKTKQYASGRSKILTQQKQGIDNTFWNRGRWRRKEYDRQDITRFVGSSCGGWPLALLHIHIDTFFSQNIQTYVRNRLNLQE